MPISAATNDVCDSRVSEQFQIVVGAAWNHSQSWEADALGEFTSAHHPSEPGVRAGKGGSDPVIVPPPADSLLATHRNHIRHKPSDRTTEVARRAGFSSGIQYRARSSAVFSPSARTCPSAWASIIRSSLCSARNCQPSLMRRWTSSTD